MRRRDFITFLAGATAWMSAARGQEPRHVIGHLSGRSDAVPGALPAFYQGLKETGIVEGRDISIEFRWADGHYDRLPTLAAELVDRHVSVIFAMDLPSAFAAKAATKTVPIVFLTGADPIKVGLIESLSRPNGNLTGVSIFFSIFGPKHVELLHELLPVLNTIAMLGNPGNENFQLYATDIRAAADALKQRLEVLTARTESDIEAAFGTMVRRGVGALIVMPDPFFIGQREQLVGLAARPYDAHDLSIQGVHRYWRPDQLRKWLPRAISTLRDLCWKNPQGRKTGRPPDPTEQQGRIGDQSQDRESTQAHRATRVARSRR